MSYRSNQPGIKYRAERRQQALSLACSLLLHILIVLFSVFSWPQVERIEEPIGPPDHSARSASIRLGKFNLGGIGPRSQLVVPADEPAPEIPAPVPTPYRQSGADMINLDQESLAETPELHKAKNATETKSEMEEDVAAASMERAVPRNRGFQKSEKRASQQTISGREFIAAFCAAYRAHRYAQGGIEESVSSIPAYVAERVAQFKNTNYTGRVMNALYRALPFVPPVRLLQGVYYRKKIRIDIVLNRDGKIIKMIPEHLSGIHEVDSSIRHLFSITEFPPIPHYLKLAEYPLSISFWVVLDPAHEQYYLRAAN